MNWLVKTKATIDEVTAKRANPVCPVCKTELIGKVFKSASGHMCCQSCFITVFGNR